jgi:hypothetical protein
MEEEFSPTIPVAGARAGAIENGVLRVAAIDEKCRDGRERRGEALHQ